MRVGVLAVVLDYKGWTERPQYDPHGIFRGWSAGWCYGGSYYGTSARRLGPRVFCVDMAGFAFDAALLQRMHGPLWSYSGRNQTGLLRVGCTSHAQCLRQRALAARYEREHTLKLDARGGESEFIEALLGPAAVPEDLQPLANCGHDLLVYHNGVNQSWPHPKWQRHRPKRFCKEDGW